jgi:hypothetical protein
METFQVLLIVIGLAIVALLAALVWRFREFEQRFGAQALRLMRSIEQRSVASSWPAATHNPHKRSAKFSQEFFVCWQWVNGDWQHQPGTLPKGATAGLPPAFPGAFHGQVVKTWVGNKA